MDTASASNAVCVCNNIISQGFDWINFWINMGGNIFAGLLSGWFVTWIYRKYDSWKTDCKRKSTVAGSAMKISVKADTALKENSYNGYQKLNDAISDLGPSVIGAKFKQSKIRSKLWFIKDDKSNEYIEEMKSQIEDMLKASSGLSGCFWHKESNDEFYKKNKRYVNSSIESYKKELETVNRKLSDKSIKFNQYIHKNDK